MNTKRLVLLAFLSIILTVQEELLTFLPNIQLTVFLLVLYSKKLKCHETLLIITLHVLLDNLFLGSFNLYYTPFMWIGWALIPLCSHTIFKKIDDSLKLAFTGVLYSFLYSWTFMIASVLILNASILSYFLADIVFELLLAISSFLSILWLYEPCSKVFDRFL